MNAVIFDQDNPIRTGFSDRNAIKSLKRIGCLRGDKDADQVHFKACPVSGVHLNELFQRGELKTVQCIESESPPTTHTQKKLVFSEVKKKKCGAQ